MGNLVGQFESAARQHFDGESEPLRLFAVAVTDAYLGALKLAKRAEAEAALEALRRGLPAAVRDYGLHGTEDGIARFSHVVAAAFHGHKAAESLPLDTVIPAWGATRLALLVVLALILGLALTLFGCVSSSEPGGGGLDPQIIAGILRETNAILDARLDLGEAIGRPELRALIEEVAARQLEGTAYEGQGYEELLAAVLEIVASRLAAEDP